MLTDAQITALKLLLAELERTTKHTDQSILHTKMIPSLDAIAVQIAYQKYVAAQQSLLGVVLDTLLDAGVTVR